MTPHFGENLKAKSMKNESNFKIGGIYENKYIGSIVEVLQYDPDYAIIEVRYIKDEFLAFRPDIDSFHVHSPFVKGLVELRYWDTPLYKKLEGI